MNNYVKVHQPLNVDLRTQKNTNQTIYCFGEVLCGR